MIRNIMLITVVVLLNISGAIAADPKSISTSQFDQQWLNTVVSIEIKDGNREIPIGTGFIVGTYRINFLLVTAKHVVQDDSGRLRKNLSYRINQTEGKSQLLSDADQENSGMGPWFVSPQEDVAIRFIFMGKGSSVKAIPLNRFLEEAQVEAGTPLTALGFPMGLRSQNHALPIARRGMVGRADHSLLLADLFVFPGNSGGPVLYVPAFKTYGVSFGDSKVVSTEMLIGIVSSYVPYQEVALSAQTNKPRIMFEENSGLANLVPAWILKKFITSGPVEKFDEKLAAKQGPAN